VKNHISNILSRLGLRDRTQAAIFARERGLL
jgi:DNA-binding NarL/FixJ family response regulator